MDKYQILIIPGWGNSGPGHWQSVWGDELPNTRRVEQREWIDVALDDWVDTLDHYVRDCRAPVVLVAHSLSCILVAHWASRCPTEAVCAALLVAPTDVEDGSAIPPETRCFAPIPRHRLPFKTIVVASADDPYTKADRAAELATCWGSSLWNIGAAGHINVAAGFGPWPEGRAILAELIQGAHCRPL